MVDTQSGGVKPRFWWERLRGWIDAHPRSGWYLAAVAIADLLLQLLDVFIELVHG